MKIKKYAKGGQNKPVVTNEKTPFENYLEKYPRRPSTDTLFQNVKVNPHPQYTPEEILRIEELEKARLNTYTPLSNQEKIQRYKNDVNKNPEIQKWLDQQKYGSETPSLEMPFLPTNYPIQEFGEGGKIKGTKQQYQAYQDSLDAYNYTQDAIKRRLERGEMQVNTSASNANWNGIQPLNDIIFSRNGMTSTVPNYIQPTYPIKLEKEDIKRKKVSNVEIDNITPNLLPTYQPDNIIETNPFIKGSYFTRPRQPQEEGQGKTDMFDKKTGKLMGTYADGGFSERKSKSGRIFKYKSYKI